MSGREMGCYRCGAVVDIQIDEWWQYRWEENPSEANVEKALEDTDFRDWVEQNYVLCPDCHERVQMCIEEGRGHA